ncbi:MAG TPA: transporter substrate-binding domain-containing protein [Pseudolabrys sp.]|nr:transporter substrate-binding domain-containing protein [Pseudolabrys sp.]
MFRRRDLAKTIVAASAVAAIAGTAAKAQTAPAGGSRLAQILARGSVRVGTTGDFNPMSFRDTGSNEYKGFDIDAATQLAKDLGVKIEWVATDWASLVAGIAANRYDIFVGGSSVNMARAKTAAFTVPYIEAGTVPLALKTNAGKFKTWESINDPGVRVAVTLGTVFHEQAKVHFPKATIQAVQAPALGFQEVLANRADVTITSNVEASTLIKRYEQLAITIDGSQMRNKRPFGYVLAQDDVTWLNYLNTWVTLKKIEGFFAELETKWLPQG